jgi:hypothetical protein
MRWLAVYCLIGLVVHGPVIVANVLSSEEELGTVVIVRTLLVGALLWPWFTFVNIKRIVSAYRDLR